MEMGKRIKQLRIANGLTQEELGKYIGVQKSAIRKYEKGEVKNIKRSSIEIMSNLFKVSPSYLMCIEDDFERKSNINTIPLISNFTTSSKISIENYFIKNININENLPTNTFALKITDNSMFPVLGVGDIAIITEDFEFSSGKTYLVLVNDNIVIRKVTFNNKEYELQALNPYYPIEKEKNLKIYGKVIQAENKSAF